MFDREPDERDVAIMLMGAIGATVESYIENDYCDPALYKLVEFAVGLSAFVGFPEMTERLKFLQLQAGEAVNKYIDEHNLDIDKNEWSK